MKIAIIGAGAMGCLYGAFLSQNHDVTMIDSFEPQINAIRENGITIQEKDGSERVYSGIYAALSGTCHTPADIVIVFVKSTYTEQALEQNSSLFADHTLAVTLQNGAGNDRKMEKYSKKENIIIGTSKHNATNLGMGISKHSAKGVTTIGSNHNSTDAVETVREVLSSAGLDVEVSDDIQRIIWSKLLINLSVNTFTAITETPIGYMIKNQHAWDFAKRLIYEAVEVAEADGTYFDRREALDMVRNLCEVAGEGYSSMYQDRKKRVPMEIDAINGAIVEQAKLYGVPTPYNTLIVDLIHAIEGAYEFYD
ncbi:MAG: 2-dehydropantoate 2-reductase [Lachnospiraceae bacterium]|nr:2-dehydropantoate 2-reductase [Lachnospiraceae bacterium]